MPAGFSNFSTIEAQIIAARDPRVDVIAVGTSSNNGAMLDNSVSSVVQNRIVEKLNKLIVAPAGNGSTAGRVLDTGNANYVMSTGQFHGSEIVKLLNGYDISSSTSVFSQGGPGPDGSIKPDLIVPSLVFSMSPVNDDKIIDRSKLLCSNFEYFSPRVTCSSGTSMAFPTAAGAAALLISAARQEGIKFSMLDIRQALILNARHISDIPIYKQGHGLIDITNSLNWLRNNSEKYNNFVVDAPVLTGVSSKFTFSNRGQGLFEWDGWEPGDVGVREIAITRISGVRESVAYAVSIVGDKFKTFSTVDKVTLPLNEKVIIPINIAVKADGVHSARLVLSDIEGGGAALNVGLTVISAITLNDANGYSVISKIGESYSSVDRIYVRIPSGIKALNVYLPDKSVKRLHIVGPTGLIDGAVERLKIGSNRDDKVSEINNNSIYYPGEGVYEITVRSMSSEYVESNILIRAFPNYSGYIGSGLSYSGASYSDIIRNGDLGYNYNILKGRDSVFWARIIRGVKKFDPFENPSVITFDIPHGVSRIDVRARLHNTKNNNNVVVMLLECLKQECYVRRYAAGLRQGGILVNVPNPGRWKLVLESDRSVDYKVDLEYEIIMDFDKSILNDAGSICVMYGDVFYGERLEDIVVFGVEIFDETVGGFLEKWSFDGVTGDYYPSGIEGSFVPLVRRIDYIDDKWNSDKCK